MSVDKIPVGKNLAGKYIENVQYQLDKVRENTEKKKRKIIVKAALFWALAIAVIFLFSLDKFLILFSAFMIFIFLASPYMALQSDYEAGVKTKILKPMFSDAGYKYDASAQNFAKHKFKPMYQECDQERYQDHIMGQVEGRSFEFCEAYIMQKKGDRSRVLFQGILLKADLLSKNIPRSIFVRSQYNSIGFKFNFQQDATDKIILEDAEFSKLFDVYSDDEVGARYYFTPQVMEAYKKLLAQFSKLDARISGQHVYLYLWTEKDYFKVASSSEKVSVSVLYRALDDIKKLIRLIVPITDHT